MDTVKVIHDREGQSEVSSTDNEHGVVVKIRRVQSSASKSWAIPATLTSIALEALGAQTASR